jgi:hypothetical protein
MLNKSCEYLIRHGAIPRGDSDISGIGVILAFLISAYITLGVVVVAYLGGLVDGSLLGRIDREVHHITPYSSDPSLLRETRKRRKRLHGCVRDVAVALSDQQIVTGIAIMSAGFVGLRSQSISVYHYQTVLYLAWMSSSVHLSVVTLLSTYLREHRGIMIWRLCGMLTLFAMLVIGVVPTISNDWGILWWNSMLEGRTGWAIPASCFWGKLWGDGVSPDAPLGFIILIMSYISKMGAIFDCTHKSYHNYIRDPLEQSLFATLRAIAMRYDSRGRTRLWLWVFRLILGIALPLLTILEVAASFAASIWLSVANLAYGTMQIVIPRRQMLPLVVLGSNENAWGFGQLVPLILLIQPLGVVFEHIWASEATDDRVQSTYSHTERASHASHTELHQAVISNRKLPLLQLMVDPEFNQILSYPRGRSLLWETLLSSRLFSMLVFLFQLALAGICATVFYLDARTIGNIRSNNWQLIICAMSGSLGFAILLTIVTAPFSIIGRRLEETNVPIPL